MRSLLQIILALIVGIMFVFGDAFLLCAQESSSEEFTLEEITVTAQKRTEDQQKVPISMAVISGEDLSLQGKANMDDILKNVANVAFQNTPQGVRVSMRGITDDSVSYNDQHVGGATVAINVDGAFNNNETIGQNLFDVERVEVLFGPQSTMYGSNAPAGIVNVVTAAPKTDKYSFSATQEIASYHTFNTQIALNVPIIQDKVAMRLAASRNVQDSYVQPDVKSNNAKAMRLKTLWNVNDKLSITATGTWDKQINGGLSANSVKLFDKQDGYEYDQITTGEGPSAVTTYVKSGKADPWTWNGEGVGNTNSQITKGLTGEINWKAPIFNVTAVPSYNKSTSYGHGSQTTTAGVYEEYEEGRGNTQKSAEVRMTNADDFTLFQWILGGTWYKSTMSNYQHFTNVSTTANDMDTIQKKKAIYANVVYPVWSMDTLRLTAGYRKSWDESRTYMPSPSGDYSWSGSPEYSKPDVKYGFEYDTSKNSMVYGSYATSYRSGSSIASPDADGKYPENEKLKAYTVGAKSRWLDNKLQVNISAYYYNYKNKLLRGSKEADGLTELSSYFGGKDMVSAVSNGRGGYSASLTPDGQYPTYVDGEIFTFDINDPNSQGTGDFTSKGVDLQTTWVVTSADRLDFSVSYLTEKWKTLNYHYYWYMIFPDASYSGVTPANAPKWSITASYEHNFMLGEYGMLTPRIDIQHKTSYTLKQDPTVVDPIGASYQEGYFKYDASATFAVASGKWSVNTYCKNITNYAVKTFYNEMQTKSLVLSEPRTYGVVLSVKF
jgi:iron complex outermembrane recepter protein